MRRAHRWTPWLCVVLTLGCTTVPATQILVHVDGSPMLRDRVVTLRLRVDADGTTAYEMSRDDVALVWPATLPITARTATEVSFVATASLDDGRAVRVSAQLAFGAGERREVWLVLSEDCIDVACGDDARRTCWEGACTDACFAFGSGPPSVPGPCTASDAGTADAGPCDEGETCGGGAGICRAGACCTGCWDGTACVTTGDAARCGSGGESCGACPCDGDRCVAGGCAPAADRTAETISTWWRRTCASSATNVWCWGLNDRGQVGDGIAMDTRPPAALGPLGRVEVRGPEHTCSADGEGQLWCWGENQSGKSGAPIGLDRLTPTAIDDGFTWASVSVGYGHSCARTITSGVFCWGLNRYGELATDPAETAASDVPVRIADGTGPFLASRVTAGLHTGFAIRDGTLVGWGRNQPGLLGIPPSATPVVMPRVIEVGEAVVNVWAAQDFACALGATGRAYCWGSAGPWLGPRTDDTTYLPAAIPDAPDGALWEELTPGGEHACAIDSEDRLWCWGLNGSGQLGDGGLAMHTTPTRVVSDRSWRSVSAGSTSSCAVTTEGAVHCWGANDGEVLGFVGAGVRVPTRVCLPAP